MNRIQNLVEDDLASTLISDVATSATPSEPDVSSEGSAHCIFTPLHYERNYAYPLIVWLHGSGGNERQVTQVMPHVSMRNYIAVGPRGTLPAENGVGYDWSQASDQIIMAERRVLASVAAARRWLNIAPSRIYLAGLGCGGTMAFRIALAQPQMFAGVLSIGGAFPHGLRPLGQLHAARRLRTFMAIGRESQQFPESQVCDTLRLFHAAGMGLNLFLYPCADDLLTNMLGDMDRWIMDQIAAPLPAEHDQPSARSGGK